MARTFEAQYEGHCGECGGDIEPGDIVGYYDETLMCEDCHEEAVESDPKMYDEITRGFRG